MNKELASDIFKTSGTMLSITLVLANLPGVGHARSITGFSLLLAAMFFFFSCLISYTALSKQDGYGILDVFRDLLTAPMAYALLLLFVSYIILVNERLT